MIGTCLLIWASFKFHRPRPFGRKVIEGIETAIAWFDRILGNPEDRPITIPKPREKAERGFQVIASNSVWIRSQALRVQLIGIASVLFAAWITVYSGGPFDSPAGQILFALPLLSPIVARNGVSILVVYAYTIVVALVFDRWIPHDGYHQTREWTIATVVAILGFSALLAARIKRNENLARRRFTLLEPKSSD